MDRINTHKKIHNSNLINAKKIKNRMSSKRGTDLSNSYERVRERLWGRGVFPARFWTLGIS